MTFFQVAVHRHAQCYPIVSNAFRKSRREARWPPLGLKGGKRYRDCRGAGVWAPRSMGLAEAVIGQHRTRLTASCWTCAVSRSFWAEARFTGSLSPRSCVTWSPSTRAVTQGAGSPTTACGSTPNVSMTWPGLRPTGESGRKRSSRSSRRPCGDNGCRTPIDKPERRSHQVRRKLIP
jgi:hypothetical protein